MSRQLCHWRPPTRPPLLWLRGPLSSSGCVGGRRCDSSLRNPLGYPLRDACIGPDRPACPSWLGSTTFQGVSKHEPQRARPSPLHSSLHPPPFPRPPPLLFVPVCLLFPSPLTLLSPAPWGFKASEFVDSFLGGAEKPMSGFAVVMAVRECRDVDLYGFETWKDKMPGLEQRRYHY